ncbi:membrane protein, partial [Streptomyces varsoviensis]
RRRRRVSMFLAGLVGTLLIIAAAVLLIGVGGNSGDDAKKPADSAASPSASGKAKPPAGVKCVGQDCTGKDPEAMGCGGASATSPASATIGSAYVEVRYSKVCGAYWARITQAAPGDAVQVAAAGGDAGSARTENGKVERDADAYTPMLAASAPLRVKACATLATGEKGCTPATAAPASPAGSPVE